MGKYKTKPFTPFIHEDCTLKFNHIYLPMQKLLLIKHGAQLGRKQLLCKTIYHSLLTTKRGEHAMWGARCHEYSNDYTYIVQLRALPSTRGSVLAIVTSYPWKVTLHLADWCSVLFWITLINAIHDIFPKRIDSRIITPFAKAQGFHYVTSTLHTSTSTSDIVTWSVTRYLVRVHKWSGRTNYDEHKRSPRTTYVVISGPPKT